MAGSPTPGEIDVRKLPVGEYPTMPLDLRAQDTYGANDGTSLAMARLADNVVVGADVDTKFVHNVLTEELWKPGTVMARRLLGTVAAGVLESSGMMFGFSAASSTHELATPIPSGSEVSEAFSPFEGAQEDGHASSFNVTVLQFPDPQRAKTAAEQMETADFALAADRNVRVGLDGRPDAKAHWRPGVPSLSATLARGGYVVNVFVAQPTPDLDGLRKLAEQIFSAQLPLLDQAPALPPREYFRMQYEPDTMMRRTLHPTRSLRLDARLEITRAPRGYLHYLDDHSILKRLFDDNGVDRISTAKEGGLLFRARDANAATALWAGINKTTNGFVDAPVGVPDVACTENPNPKPASAADLADAWDGHDRYLCTLRYDRYVARVASYQLIDAQQKAAAQYALLANAQYL